MSTLFSPLTIRGLELKNRVVVGPMATYSAVAGMAGDWHLTHLARFAAGGAALIFYEATAIMRQGRVIQGGAGIWQDEHVPPLLRLSEFLRQHGAATAIQLLHSGSGHVLPRPWDGPPDNAEEQRRQHQAYWDLGSPGGSEPGRRAPAAHEFSRSYLEGLLEAYELATRRAAEARFDVLEIHGGVGSLLHEFLAPASNRRGDEYGGDRESRMSFPLEVVERVRAVWPPSQPLFYRLTPLDNAQTGWRAADTVDFAAALGEKGVDVIDLTSGGTPLVDAASGQVGGLQLETAERLRQQASVSIMLGGAISRPAQSEAALQQGLGDLVALARELLWNPNWPLHAAQELGDDPDWGLWPHPFGWARPGKRT
ncbi:MAG TPA: NADH:flavin oxidoreductase/NADH oxidase [Alphaproteobacteria bacterium]|nr:NADH:flavin oxidoreductase/NADH oxidase [Alphaproteobacteria bacterium]